MNDIWANWEEGMSMFQVEDCIIYIRTFVDEDGDCFTIASIFNPETNISKAVFYRGWN